MRLIYLGIAMLIFASGFSGGISFKGHLDSKNFEEYKSELAAERSKPISVVVRRYLTNVPAKVSVEWPAYQINDDGSTNVLGQRTNQIEVTNVGGEWLLLKTLTNNNPVWPVFSRDKNGNVDGVGYGIRM